MLWEILKTKTIEHSSVSLFGTLFNGALGLLFYILSARMLGPDNFGIFILAITTLVLITDISNLGLDTGIIKFVGKYITSDRTKAYRFLKLIFELKLILGVLVSVLGFFLLPIISQLFFLKRELVIPFRLSILGILSLLLFSFSTNTLQATQKYFQWSTVNIVSNLLRLIFLFIFFSYFNLSASLAILSFILAPLVGFLIAVAFLPNFYSSRNEYSVGSELISFNKWLILITIVSTIGSRIDTFVTGRLLSVYELGLYGAASQLVSFFPQINYAIAASVAPKISGFQDKKNALRYFFKLQALATGVVLFFLLSLPIGVFIFPMLLSLVYKGGLVPFIILYISQLLFLLALPSHQYIYYFFSYPKFFASVSFFQLILVLIGSILFIPKFGINGPAMAVLVGSVFNLIISLLWVSKKFISER